MISAAAGAASCATLGLGVAGLRDSSATTGSVGVSATGSRCRISGNKYTTNAATSNKATMMVAGLVSKGRKDRLRCSPATRNGAFSPRSSDWNWGFLWSGSRSSTGVGSICRVLHMLDANARTNTASCS